MSTKTPVKSVPSKVPSKVPAKAETAIPANIYNDFPKDMTPELRSALMNAIVGVQPVIRVDVKLAELLRKSQYNHNNRPISEPNVKELVNRMTSDEWVSFVGDSVIFSRNHEGKLGGGSFQHRAKALIDSGLPDIYFDAILVPNLPAAAGDLIDTGKTRGAGDVVARMELFSNYWEGNKNRQNTASRHLASALRLIDARYRLRKDVDEVKGKFGPARVAKEIVKYEYLTDLTVLAMQLDNDYFPSGNDKSRRMAKASLSVIMPIPYWITAFQIVVNTLMKEWSDENYAKVRKYIADEVGNWLIKGTPKDLIVFLKKFGISHARLKSGKKEDSPLVPGFTANKKDNKYKARDKAQLFHAMLYYLVAESGLYTTGTDSECTDGTFIPAMPMETVDSFLKACIEYNATTNPDGYKVTDDSEGIERLTYFGQFDVPEPSAEPDNADSGDSEEVQEEPEETAEDVSEEVQEEPEDEQFEEEVEEEEEKPIRRGKKVTARRK